MLFERITNRNVRSGLGVIFILFGLVIGALPLVPGILIIIAGFELLGVHILSMDDLKRGTRNGWRSLLVKLRIRG
jgi:hypothetical protein